MGTSSSRIVLVWIALCACGDNIVPEVDAGPEALAPSIDTIAPMQVVAGDPIAITCTLTEGTVVEPITTVVQGELVVTDEASVVRSGGGLIARVAGSVLVACKLPDRELVDATPAMIEIVVGPAANIVTEINPAPVTAGETITATCTVYDSQGNVVSGTTPELELSPIDSGNTITDLTAEMTRAGSYTGRCVLPGATSNPYPFSVVPALPANIALAKSPDLPVYAVGDAVFVTYVVTDRFGNEIFQPGVALDSVAITGVGPTTPIPPQTFEYDGEGTYRIDGAVTDPTDGGTPVTASVTVTVNSIGPAIVCGSPGDGTMVNATPGGALTVSGTATDVSGVTSVRVNGLAATLGANGAFSRSITSRFGINFAKIEAFDQFGVPTTKYCSFLVANQWGNPGATTGDIVMLKLAQSAVDDADRAGALDSIGDILHAVVNSSGLATALHSALLAANPLKASGCDEQVCLPFVGCTCVLRSEILYVSSSLLGPKTASITLVANGLRVNARFEDVRIRLRARGHVAGINFDTTGNVDIDFLDVTMILDPSISGGSPRVTVRGGSVSTSVGSISTDFGGLDGAIINFVVSIANGTVRNLVRDTVTGYVQNNFDATLDSLLGGLDISTLGTTFNVPRLAGGGTVPLNFAVDFSSINTSASRMLFGIGTRMSGSIANAYGSLGVAIVPGSIATDPAMAGNTAVAVHSALLNQALHALWKANYFVVTLPGASIGLPSSVSIALNARLPPVAMMTAAGTIELSLGAVDAVLQYPGLPANTAVTFGARARTTTSLSGNDLVFGGILLDEVRVSSDLFTFDATELADLEMALGQAAQTLITQSLNNALPAIPIPAFEIPAALGSFGLPVGEELGVVNPTLANSPPHFLLRGNFGLR